MTSPDPPQGPPPDEGEVDGSEPVPHYGDPGAEYAAATEGVAVRDRSQRAQWRFSGRQPMEMLKGIVTGRLPHLPLPGETGILAGAATYQAVLTPKGRMIADLFLWREPEGDGEVVRAHLPAKASAPLRDHLSRILPPRLARLEDRSGEMGMLALVGPGAARLASAVVLGLRVEAHELEEMGEGEYRLLSPPDGDRLLVLRNGDLSVPAFDIVAEVAVLRSLWTLLTGSGAVPMGMDAWTVLRVERGRPAFPAELGPDVIPVEAGIQDRAIDDSKGCYTGQEVIVRIRDRGHVNRHLRRLELDGAAPLPARGTELHRDGKVVGTVTTSVDSPRQGKLALAYVRREVATGDRVHVGGEEGPLARVEALPEA